MLKFMVIETFVAGATDAVYHRFEHQGRMLPDGLHYIDSWLEAGGQRCFQLMETARPELFPVWIDRWCDLASFEVIELGEKPSPTT